MVDPDSAVPEVLAELSAVLGVTAAPAWTHVQRWSFARPAAGREQSFHLGDARVGLCGDGWGAPRVETAWLSGHRLGLELVARLGG
jgi:predicted NAD/FAD-dependent oxidoreductase